MSSLCEVPFSQHVSKRYFPIILKEFKKSLCIVEVYMFGLKGPEFIIILVPLAVCAIASGNIASKKGYSYSAFALLGLITGLIGVIVAAVLPDKRGGDADTLLKYKELLEKGVITQEEFDKKKSELIK